MGFFGTSYSLLEQQLLDTYTESFILVGFGRDKAKKISKGLLDKCIKEAKLEGTYNLPSNLGQQLLSKEGSDDKITQLLEIKRAEGVTSEDILWWWGLNDIERRMMIAVDEVNILSSFSQLRESGHDVNEAGILVRKSFAVYGEPSDEDTIENQNRPIPYELKNRINIYIEKYSHGNLDKFRQDRDKFSSFNAFLRETIIDKKI